MDSVHFEACSVKLEVLKGGILVVASGEDDWNGLGGIAKHDDELLVFLAVVGNQVIRKVSVY